MNNETTDLESLAAEMNNLDALTSGVEYSLDIESDDCEVAGSFGSDAESKAMVATIIERHNSGDIWAWFQVRVKAEWRGIVGYSSWLGGCSYESESDYKTNSGYYTDQCSEALDSIRNQLNYATRLPDGSVYTARQQRALAHAVYERFARDLPSATAAWRRMLQNNCSESAFRALLDLECD